MNLLRAAAVAAGLAALAAPGVATAATSNTSQAPVRFAMQTQFLDTYRPGAVEGRLNLTVYPNGIVNGFYVPDGGRVEDVVGGVDGQNIWLDLGGTMRSLHLNGTLKNGVLRATAAIPGPDTYVFESTTSVRLGTP